MLVPPASYKQRRLPAPGGCACAVNYVGICLTGAWQVPGTCFAGAWKCLVAVRDQRQCINGGVSTLRFLSLETCSFSALGCLLQSRSQLLPSEVALVNSVPGVKIRCDLRLAANRFDLRLAANRRDSYRKCSFSVLYFLDVVAAHGSGSVSERKTSDDNYKRA